MVVNYFEQTYCVFNVFVDRYELDGEDFKWCVDAERHSEFKGSFPVASIIAIRFQATDPSITKESQYTFEFETHERIYSLGCETAAEKDCWMTALTVARDAALLKRSAYSLQVITFKLANVFGERCVVSIG